MNGMEILEVKDTKDKQKEEKRRTCLCLAWLSGEEGNRAPGQGMGPWEQKIQAPGGRDSSFEAVKDMPKDNQDFSQHQGQPCHSCRIEEAHLWRV